MIKDLHQQIEQNYLDDPHQRNLPHYHSPVAILVVVESAFQQSWEGDQSQQLYVH